MRDFWEKHGFKVLAFGALTLIVLGCANIVFAALSHMR